MENKIKPTLQKISRGIRDAVIVAALLGSCSAPFYFGFKSYQEDKERRSATYWHFNALVRNFEKVSDTNNNGVLELPELAAALKKLGFQGTVRDCPHSYKLEDYYPGNIDNFNDVGAPSIHYHGYQGAYRGIVNLPMNELEKLAVEGK